VTAVGAIAPGLPAPEATAPGTGGVRRAYRAERRKLTAHLATRLLVVLCAIGPFAFTAVLKAQSGTPADALFGIWVHSSGFAVSLVVLGFAGSWGFPLMAGVLCGDVFSAEDRYGTWKTILTRSRTRRELFAGKLLAAAAFSCALVALTAACSVVAGLVFVGDGSLVSLSGTLLPPGRSLALVVIAWVVCVPAVLAYAGLAVLFSVATRNGIVGVIGPSLVALLTQLLDLIGRGVWVHMLLIGSAFDAWHGLLTVPAFFGPLGISLLVSLVWIGCSLGGSWLLLRRRDFAGTAGGRAAGWSMPLRVRRHGRRRAAGDRRQLGPRGRHPPAPRRRRHAGVQPHHAPAAAPAGAGRPR
jgi:ABC-2 type transport system permease protein